jgi:two-component system sensor histidine kinase KdpD
MMTGIAEQPAPGWQVLFCGLARHAAQATEADRGRAALLETVSHDLRAPLAAAKAAVSGLRSRAVGLTADDRAELLAAAEESLDLLGRLTASLLDVSRLQAGALAVFPRPANLGQIVADSLDALGPQGRTVLADIPDGLREVMAEPAITERAFPRPTGSGRSCPSSGSADPATGPVSASGSWCPGAWRRRWAA